MVIRSHNSSHPPRAKRALLEKRPSRGHIPQTENQEPNNKVEKQKSKTEITESPRNSPEGHFNSRGGGAVYLASTSLSATIPGTTSGKPKAVGTLSGAIRTPPAGTAPGYPDTNSDEYSSYPSKEPGPTSPAHLTGS